MLMLPTRAPRGVALVVALLVVALATMLVAALLVRGELALARTRNALRATQAQAYAQGLEAYAAKLLAAPSEGADTHLSLWAQPMPPQQVPGGILTAQMRDLDGCFNLNNLVPEHRDAWRALFQRLLKALLLDPRIAQSVEEWLDPQQADAPAANAYLGRAVPYRAHGGVFTHVSELRLLRGIDAAAYARLAPQVCVLPPGTRINVNTADVPLLQALLGNAQSPATAASVQSVWQNGQAQWSDLTQFWQAASGGRVPAGMAALVDTQSNDFLLRGEILLDDIPFVTFSVLQRQGGSVRVIQRSRGADAVLTEAAPIGGDAGAP